MYKPIALRFFLRHLEETGGSPDAILEGTGVSYAEICALTIMSAQTMADLLDRLARRTAEDFAIDCALATRTRHLGLLGCTIANCPTARDVFQTWLKYSRVAGNPLIGTLRESDGRWAYVLRPRFPMTPEALRFCVEAAIFGAGPVLEELTGTPVTPLSYSVTFGRGSDKRYERVPETRLQFHQSENKLVGSIRDLDARTSFTDPDAWQTCDAQCAHELARLEGATSYSERLVSLFTARQGSLPSIEEAAAAFGIGPRSLYRRLAEEGHSYQKLVDSYRRDYALKLMSEGPTDIKRAAHLLGFKDIGSFRRVFRRWTGEPVRHWARNAAPRL